MRQTRILLQAESPLRWECLRQTVQYLGAMCTFRVLNCLRMMVWLILVSWSRKALACSGVLKDTLMDLGGDMDVGVRCWMR